VSKAESVYFTESGLRVSESAFRKLFCRGAEVENTWIVDLRHYLTPAGAMAELPPRARILAEYFASIVLDATSNLDDPPTVRCRRRWRRQRCRGIVVSYPSAEEDDRIDWYCPLCHDNGIIRSWKGTLWDGFTDRPVVS
jgi:hypothetical protein